MNTLLLSYVSAACAQWEPLSVQCLWALLLDQKTPKIQAAASPFSPPPMSFSDSHGFVCFTEKWKKD